MSPFNMFKKPSKKDTNQPKADAAQRLEDPSLLSAEMQKKRHDAALEFLQAFQEKMPLMNGKPHVGTVLAAAAYLAGTSLYRAMNYKKNASPGVVVLSEEVDQAWPQLMNLFAYYCKQNGLDVMAKDPVTQFPEKDKPLLTVDQVLREYQDQYLEIMKKHGLDYLNAARSGIVVCSVIFEYHKKSKEIDPYVATGIVARGVLEGAKTAPPPLREGTKTGTKNMSRLVLGEPDAARREALATGAIYIELNPEAQRMLEQQNIDPFLIYEQGVRKQMEERIARIDFVNVDVEKSFQEWQHKSQTQAPIHVRLIFWLKDNADAYGYKQSGNSWVLK